MASVYAAIAPSKSPLSRSKLPCFVASSSRLLTTRSPPVPSKIPTPIAWSTQERCHPALCDRLNDVAENLGLSASIRRDSGRFRPNRLARRVLWRSGVYGKTGARFRRQPPGPSRREPELFYSCHEDVSSQLPFSSLEMGDMRARRSIFHPSTRQCVTLRLSFRQQRIQWGYSSISIQAPHNACHSNICRARVRRSWL
jgi:hypothetical protein